MSDSLDRFGRGQSLCHRWPPLLKLLIAVSMILAANCVPMSRGPLVGLMTCVIFFAHTLARIPLVYVAKRLILFWPPLILMSLSLPLSQAGRSGWLMSIAIFVRGTLSFTAALWLVNVMPFGQLLLTLRRLNVPDVLLAILSQMYRFLFVLWDELDRMRMARRARSFGKLSAWTEWKVSAAMLSRLLIRALDRADRVHQAMLARGWTGETHWIDPRPENRS